MPWLMRFDSDLPEWVATFENLSLETLTVGPGYRVRGVALTETLVLERKLDLIRVTLEGEMPCTTLTAYRDIAGPPALIATDRTVWHVQTLKTLWEFLVLLDKDSQSKFGMHIAPTLRNLLHSDDPSVREIVDATLHGASKPRR